VKLSVGIVLILSTIAQKLSSKMAGFAIIFVSSLLFSLPVHAYKPASIETRIQKTPYVFDGTVTRVERDKLTIRVKRYFKGKGSQNIVLSGFNQTSCQNIIQGTGGRYLFFAQPQDKNNWNAVYDGAFGSLREWNKNTEAELKKLGLIKS